MLALADPILGELEKQAVLEVLESKWLTMGEKVKIFEQNFAALHQVPQAIAVNSCTAGLHIGLAALGIGPGDEVLVPSLTFVATINAVLYVGATPVFVDIESLTEPHISLAQAKAHCTPKTKAVIIMHYGGYVMDIPAWRAFADERGLYLLEDVAHAPGAPGVGLLSDVSVFSFFSNKNMTTAEGGMVIALDEAVGNRVRALRTHGMTTTTLDRHKGHAYSYDVTMLGFNYRLDELRAAIGIVQLGFLPTWNQKRVQLSAQYRTLLAQQCPSITIPFTATSPTVGHLMPVLLPSGVTRPKVMDQLRAEQIQSSIHYPPAHHFSWYQTHYPSVSLPLTEQFSATELSLPLHPGMTEQDVSRVVATLATIVADCPQ